MTQEIKADYCIAGVGIAGALLAAKLSESGKNVVLLDQGPRYSEEDRAAMIKGQRETLNDFADFNDGAPEGVVTPHSSAHEGDDAVPWTHQRIFGVGGSALHYEGNMTRPREEDLQVKTLYGYGRDWPLTYGELEPWLLKAEHETGVACSPDNPYASARSGPFPMEGHPPSYFDREIMGPALKRIGITGHSSPRAIATRPYRGRSPCLACRACKFCPSGARYSPDRVQVPVLDSRTNVTILEKVSLRRLEVSARGDRIRSAQAIRLDDRKPVVIRAERFVVAMGGVETTRLLMLSAGPGEHREGLGNSGGQLGRRFSDHFNIFAAIDAGRNVGSRLGFETMTSEHFRVNIDRREEPTFILYTAPAIDWVPAGIYAADWAAGGGDSFDLGKVRAAIPRMAFMYAMTELGGNGTIDLDSRKVDAFGDPVAKITMRLSDWDRRSRDAFAGLLPKIAESMEALHISEIYPDFGMGYHPSGAAAMALSPADGVCDPDLKVFGLDNLYLVSNSTFPHMGSNPPTLTIAALALRLAAHLDGRVR
ncbi:GMC oxidoreductase [Candidatus Moduliflexota bacterium]